MDLFQYLRLAREGRFAIGHFNFATADVLRAIVEGAKESGAPAVMVGTSENEAEFIGIKEAVALMKVLNDKLQFPVFLNADHFKSFEKCQEAIDAGYDAVLIDGSRLPFEENVALVKKVVEYAKEVSKSRDAEITIEGELGYLRGTSEIQEKVEISPADYTDPDQAREFIERTGVASLAVVFGNIHGIVTEQEEKLDIEHLKKIAGEVPEVFLVLHGASGLKDQDVSAAIEAGIVNVHFNTELRVAYKEAIDSEIHSGAGDAPYKYLGKADEEVRKVVVKKIGILNKAQLTQR